MNPHCWWILVRTVPHGTGTCVCLRCRGLGWRACNGRRFLLGVLHGYLGRVFGWSESRPSSMFYILVPCASCSVGVLLGPAYVGFSTMGMGGPPKFSGSPHDSIRDHDQCSFRLRDSFGVTHFTTKMKGVSLLFYILFSPSNSSNIA